jgi:rhodanese-related sulfurtransferase
MSKSPGNASNEPVAIDPPEAYRMLTENPQAYMIDVRSTMEHLMVGHPVGAIHIPWLDEPDFTPNPKFVTQVREVMLGGLLGADEENGPAVLLICRSGRRSHEAGVKLVEAGMRNVYNVAGGFEGPLDDGHHRSSIAGWRFHGLPWQQC